VGELEMIDAEEPLAAVSARARLMFKVFGGKRYLKRPPDVSVRAA
jgi:hypothetical protein